MDIIYETDTRNGCQTCQKPRINHSKESSPNPYTCQEDDTPATEGDTRMRTSEVGLVNDVTLIGNLKIKKFHPEEQN